jgi:hypothetical protein
MDLDLPDGSAAQMQLQFQQQQDDQTRASQSASPSTSGHPASNNPASNAAGQMSFRRLVVDYPWDASHGMVSAPGERIGNRWIFLADLLRKATSFESMRGTSHGVCYMSATGHRFARRDLKCPIILPHHDAEPRHLGALPQ